MRSSLAAYWRQWIVYRKPGPATVYKCLRYLGTPSSMSVPHGCTSLASEGRCNLGTGVRVIRYVLGLHGPRHTLGPYFGGMTASHQVSPSSDWFQDSDSHRDAILPRQSASPSARWRGTAQHAHQPSLRVPPVQDDVTSQGGTDVCSTLCSFKMLPQQAPQPFVEPGVSSQGKKKKEEKKRKGSGAW